MCDCRYASDPKTGVPEAVLDQSKYFPNTERPRVSVDSCIADVIERLWEAGVKTGGCCCGHNGTKGPPSVFLLGPQYAERAFEVLAEDNRDWSVMFWAGKGVNRMQPLGSEFEAAIFDDLDSLYEAEAKEPH